MINALKTILYMGFMHGMFTVYLPYQLASFSPSSFDVGFLRFFAFPFWLIGLGIVIQCSVDFIRRGRGTPAHLDPPKQLVIAGLYRYVRNPIYLGALIVQLGYIVWFGSWLSVLYTFLFFLGFHTLIIFIEEPILRNNFGAAYEEYCRNVPRWIPKLKP